MVISRYEDISRVEKKRISRYTKIMKNIKKNIKLGILVFIILLICDYALDTFSCVYIASRIDAPITTFTSNEDLKNNLKRKYKEKSSKNIERYIADKTLSRSSNLDAFFDVWEDGFVVPNLGVSINHCEYMTPQGLCVVGNNIIITEYCNCDKKHNTLVCFIDKTTGEYVKTVELEFPIHAGGITYDSKSNEIVITGKDLEDGASMYFYDYDDFEEAKEGKTVYHTRQEIIPLESPSFVSYNKNLDEIFVGYFSPSVNGGEMYLMNNEKLFKNLPQGMQGCSFFKNKVAISTSYGVVSSEIVVKDIKNGVIQNNCAKIINCPPYLEEFYIDEVSKKAYLLFESGSKRYRDNTNLVIDRIVVLDFSRYL